MGFKQRLAWVLLAIAPAAVAAPWKYEARTDQMTDERAFHATVRSANQLNLGFPYEGPTRATLRIRSHPKHGIDVIVQLDQGQTLCRSNACDITVRFDEERPEIFKGVGPADHSSQSVFLQNTGRFIKAARYANRILISVPIYQAGEPVLEFRPDEPLMWEHGENGRGNRAGRTTEDERRAEYLERLRGTAQGGPLR